EPTARVTGEADLLDEALVEAKVVGAETAERLGHLHREHPLGGGLREQLTGDDPVSLPGRVVRGDLLGHEATDRLTVIDVLGFEQSSLHRVRSTRPISGPYAGAKAHRLPLGLAHRREFSVMRSPGWEPAPADCHR